MRELPEWIGKSDDDPIPPRVRLRVFERSGGFCAKCGRKLVPGHWECDHITALGNHGKHVESNLWALCELPCHSDKTKQDVAEKALVSRKRKKHLGIKTKKRTIPGRLFDGTPIPSRWR